MAAASGGGGGVSHRLLILFIRGCWPFSSAARPVARHRRDVQRHLNRLNKPAVKSIEVKLSFLYPAMTGRNMEEVLRVVESLQKAVKYKVSTPADWKPGEPVAISPGVSNEEAKKMFPQGFETKELPSGKEYLRFTNV